MAVGLFSYPFIIPNVQMGDINKSSICNSSYVRPGLSVYVICYFLQRTPLSKSWIDVRRNLAEVFYAFDAIFPSATSRRTHTSATFASEKGWKIKILTLNRPWFENETFTNFLIFQCKLVMLGIASFLKGFCALICINHTLVDAVCCVWCVFLNVKILIKLLKAS